MIDYRKIERQLDAQLRMVRKPLREVMVQHLKDAYTHLEAGDLFLAKNSLYELEMAAKQLKWNGGGSALPRPLHRKHLERLYWQAQKLVNGVEQPRRTGSGKPTLFMDKGWF